MNYIIAEITHDDTLKVIAENVRENEIRDKVDSYEYIKKNLIAIPCKTIRVEGSNFGYNTEVEIK